MKEEVGPKIRAVRDHLGIKQTDLAEQVGLDRTALSRIENGKRRVSSTELRYFAAALGVKPDQLLGGTPVVQRFRLGDGDEEAANATLRWLNDYVDDALFLKRAADRYGVA
jgi:transcriptional regulator with XRE-family HTH domain